MFAIAFDLVVAEAQKHHPKGVAQAYSDAAVVALKKLVWLPSLHPRLSCGAIV